MGQDTEIVVAPLELFFMRHDIETVARTSLSPDENENAEISFFLPRCDFLFLCPGNNKSNLKCKANVT